MCDYFEDTPNIYEALTKKMEESQSGWAPKDTSRTRKIKEYEEKIAGLDKQIATAQGNVENVLKKLPDRTAKYLDYKEELEI